MMSDLILFSQADLPPVILVPLPQFINIQHLGTDTQLAREYTPLNMDGFLNPCHPQVGTQPQGLIEEPANRSSGACTSQNSSISSLDYSDLTLFQSALPAETGVGEEKESALFETPTPTSQDQRFGSDVEDLSQWQSEFRGQIRALRQWLKSMEMRLPALDPRVMGTSLGHRGAGESGSIVPGLDSQAGKVLGTRGPLHT
ncbi:hypothetical protein Q8A73_008293 [Channa argus]|nr:hypothetical protein Q8A73_008293 [Channa argus]